MHAQSAYTDLDKIKRECELVIPKLKPGDVLIHHCLMVHGSNENKSEKNNDGLKNTKVEKNSDNLKKHDSDGLKHANSIETNGSLKKGSKSEKRSP